MKTFVCKNCNQQIQRPAAPLRCDYCGAQRIGLFRETAGYAPPAGGPYAPAPGAPAPGGYQPFPPTPGVPPVPGAPGVPGGMPGYPASPYQTAPQPGVPPYPGMTSPQGYPARPGVPPQPGFAPQPGVPPTPGAFTQPGVSTQPGMYPQGGHCAPAEPFSAAGCFATAMDAISTRGAAPAESVNAAGDDASAECSPTTAGSRTTNGAAARLWSAALSGHAVSVGRHPGSRRLAPHGPTRPASGAVPANPRSQPRSFTDSRMAAATDRGYVRTLARHSTAANPTAHAACGSRTAPSGTRLAAASRLSAAGRFSAAGSPFWPTASTSAPARSGTGDAALANGIPATAGCVSATGSAMERFASSGPSGHGRIARLDSSQRVRTARTGGCRTDRSDSAGARLAAGTPVAAGTRVAAGAHLATGDGGNRVAGTIPGGYRGRAPGRFIASAPHPTAAAPDQATRAGRLPWIHAACRAGSNIG